MALISATSWLARWQALSMLSGSGRRFNRSAGVWLRSAVGWASLRECLELAGFPAYAAGRAMFTGAHCCTYPQKRMRNRMAV